MSRFRTCLSLVVLLVPAVATHAVEYREIMASFDRAKAAIDSGNVVPERDLAPIIDLLRKSADDQENRERIIDRLETIADAHGSSPAAVKSYLLEQSTPILIEISENQNNTWSLRGTAMLALRDMGAPRSVLERLVAMAAKDTNDYVRSRGEILEGFVSSMPPDAAQPTVQPSDAAKEAKAIAFLESRNVGVSLDQLRLSAVGVEPDEIQALLDAGVDPNGGAATESPINRLLSACASHGESDDLLRALDILLEGGADLGRKDDNGNTPLMSAAQNCGGKVTARLIDAGAEVNVTNGSQVTPIMMAFFTNHLDAAETLAEHGARLTAEQAGIVSANVSDPRAKAIIQKALGQKTKSK